MLSARVCTLPGRTAAHAWWTALFSSATVEGGSFMSRIQTDIWSQTCSIGFMSGLRAGQSTISTSCWSKNAAVSRAVCQSLGCVAKFCLCILETPPASWLLLAESCHLPATGQFAAVFAMANFVAGSPLKVQRNINSLYRNPTLHKSIKVVMARQTSLQVTTPELTFSFSWVSAIPRQYWLRLAIQFGCVMDRWYQQYFVPHLNIRPETINTYQIHANAI